MPFLPSLLGSVVGPGSVGSPGRGPDGVKRCLWPRRYSQSLKTPSPACVPALLGPPGLCLLSKSLTGLSWVGAQEARGIAHTKSPSPGASSARVPAQSRSQGRPPQGWHGPGRAGGPQAQPGTDPLLPHPPRPPLGCSQARGGEPQPPAFAHAPLKVARSRVGVGACGGRRTQAGGADAQGQSQPVIKSSARWRPTHPPGQQRATPATPCGHCEPPPALCPGQARSPR